LLFKKPIIFFPQSFGPFYNPVAGYFLKKILLHKETATILAREEISLNLLKKLIKNDQKLEICPDIAFCLSKEIPSKEASYHLNLPRPVIALTLRQWLFPDAASKIEREEKKGKYLNALKETCHYIARSLKGSILILPQVRGPGNLEDDRIISRRLFKDLEDVIPESNRRLLNLDDAVDPLFIIQILSQVDLVVATRFHSAIFALIARIPVISISYQPKSKGIMEQLELDKYCLDISTLESAEITRLIDEIMGDYSSIQTEIIHKVNHLSKTIETKLSNSIQPWISQENENTPSQ
jgi:colanic acid/amylovoran biosynthesis protein